MNKKNNVRMSNEAVQSKTGKTWEQWFKILDAAGAKKMTHKEIVAVVKKYDAGPWWQQMVTVTYEQARGMREKHEKPGGYEISASKTIAASAEAIYEAWNSAKLRSTWLPEKPITIRTATPGKSMRITWVDGKSGLDVNFYEKGKDKCQITVQHSKLPDATAANRMKAFWKEKLEKLDEKVSM
jgi:hypothetical protein